MRHPRHAARAALLCLLALPAAAAATTSGHSGWTWSNPTPQGHALRDLLFLGGTGYAVGDFGTLLTTSDQGATWRESSSATFTDLARVTPAGTGVLASGGCVARRTTDAGATVTRVPVAGGETTCPATVATTAFSDADHGFIVMSDGAVLSTSDGGRTLSRRTPINTLGQVPRDAAITGTGVVVAVGNTIWRSTDGGASWSVASSSGSRFQAFWMVNPLVGYVVGTLGGFWKTVDGGASWTDPRIGAAPLWDYTDISCADENTCLMATGTTGLVRTQTGGAAFDAAVNPTDRALYSVAFASATRAVAVGAGGETVLSDDSGRTWRSVSGRIAGTLSGIASAPGVIAGWGLSGLVVRSADGGSSWTTASLPSGAFVRTARFADAQTGYALAGTGDAVEMWKTTNGGASWALLDPGPSPDRLTELLVQSPARVLLVGSGDVRVSGDGGTTFTPVAETAVRRAGRLQWAFRVGRGAVVAGPQRILVSANGRTGWKGVPRPTRRGKAVSILDISCSAKGVCWVYSTSGRLYVTTDLGRRYRDVTATLPAVGIFGVRDIAVTDARRGYIALRSPGIVPGVIAGQVLRTTDGGNTWTPQVVGALEPAQVITGTPDVLLGADGSVLTTTTGGAAGIPSVLGLTPSPRTITRRTTVTITGRLRPASGGERVAVTASGQGVRFATVASSGTFSLSFTISKTTTFVAHWAGDGIRQGDGSPVITVTRR